MSLEAFKWSVVVVGRWNTAILTPGRIAKKIFLLPTNRDVEVLVPIDGLSLFQVKHPAHGIVVVPSDARLQFYLTQQTYEEMDAAKNCAVAALDWLPETPFSAAGFNINFRTNTPSPAQLKLLQCDPIDNELASIDTIQKRSLSRSLNFEDGELNVEISGKADLFEVHFNFHLASDEKDALAKWLRVPMPAVQRVVKEVTAKLKLDIQEKTNGQDTE